MIHMIQELSGRTLSDMAILLDVIVGHDPEDSATTRAEGHRSPTYRGELKNDALKGARLGVLRQVFKPAVADPRSIAHFDMTLDELKAAGAEIVDPFVVPELDSIPRPPQTSARFKTTLPSGSPNTPGCRFHP